MMSAPSYSAMAAQLEVSSGLKVAQGELLSKHTSLRIGGPADLFITAKTVDELVAAVRAARSLAIPFLVIGNGTNLLALDGGVRGLVIKSQAHHIERVVLDADGNTLPPEQEQNGVVSLWRVDAGVLFTKLARLSVEQGWTGAEWGNSIPGSIGGGVVSNAGAHGGDMKSNLTRVWVLGPTNAIEEWPVEKLALGYRTSVFKAHGAFATRGMSPDYVVLRAEMKLTRGAREQGEQKMRDYLAQRQKSQPQGKSAGSTFKNPPGDAAGRLIESVGLKGFQHGAAAFSAKHANFMMNLGGATAADVLYLLELARSKVRREQEVELETEMEIIGQEGSLNAS